MQKSILEQANLDWSVRTEKLVTVHSNLPTDNVAIIREGRRSVNPEGEIVRENDCILGVHSSSYVALQNSEMMDILDRISGMMGLPLHKGGYFGNGEKVYIQLKTEDKRLGNDQIKGYLTCVNSFDGSTSLAFGHSNLTISCQNTFFANYREMTNKVRHTMNMHTRIDLLCTQIEGVLQAEQKIFTQIERMADVRIDQKVRDMVMARMLNLQGEERLADIKTLSTQKVNLMNVMDMSITDQIADKGDNIWGLFSGITHYTTHKLKGDANENKLFGRFGNREREVFAELGNLVMA
jgi:hypothetical protein